jgi:hypothetical protein
MLIEKLLFDDAVSIAEFINEELHQRMITSDRYIKMEWRERCHGLF